MARRARPDLPKMSLVALTLEPSENRTRQTSRTPWGYTPVTCVVSPVGLTTSSPTCMSSIRRKPVGVRTKASMAAPCRFPPPPSAGAASGARPQVDVDLLDRALLVAGELERQRPAPAVDHHPARLERPRATSLAAGAPAPRHGELEQEQLLEREPPPRVALVLLTVGEVDGGERRRAGRVAPPRRADERAAGRPTRTSAGTPSTRAPAAAAGSRPASPGAPARAPRCAPGASAPSSSCSVTQNWLRWRSLPCRRSWAPSPSWRASQGWLNQTATSGPLSSNTRASTRF